MSRIEETGGPRFNRRSESTGQNRSTFVQPGERMMADIARRLQMLEQLLIQYNPQIPNPNALEPGMEVFTSRRFTLGKSQGGQQAGMPQSTSGAAAERSFEQMFEAAMRKQAFQTEATPAQTAAQTTAAPVATPFGTYGKTEPGTVGTVWGAKPTTAAAGDVAGPTPNPLVYDPKVGPRITPDMWTTQMLVAPLTQDLLANQKDPAAFLNARKELFNQPSPAKVVNLFDGSSQPLSGESLSSREEVETLYNHLQALGMTSAEISDQAPVGLFRVDYNGETRRHWAIGGINVGQLLMRYATTPVEEADRLTKQELQSAGLLGGPVS